MLTSILWVFFVCKFYYFLQDLCFFLIGSNLEVSREGRGSWESLWVLFSGSAATEQEWLQPGQGEQPQQHVTQIQPLPSEVSQNRAISGVSNASSFQKHYCYFGFSQFSPQFIEFSSCKVPNLGIFFSVTFWMTTLETDIGLT